MSFFKSLSAVAVLAAATSAANAAVTLAWVEVTPIDPTAFTTAQAGNTTENAVIPAGVWNTWELRLTATGGDKFGGAALRAALPAGSSFYRNTVIDPNDEVTPLNLAANQLFSTNGAPSNPPRKYTTGVASPTNPAATALLGSLRADGTQGPESEIQLPNGLNGIGDSDDQVVSVVWGITSQVGVDGTAYTIARLTANTPLSATLPGANIVGQGSVVNTIVAGSPGAPVAIPALNSIIPEPTMGFALAGMGLLGLRRRK